MMKAKIKRIAFFIVVLLGLLVSGSMQTRKLHSFSLGDQVTLEGTVIAKVVWGPPNFGEEPNSDSKGEIFLLSLRQKIQIKRNNNASDSKTKKRNIISEIQLNGPREVLKSYEDKKVCVSGIIYEATAPMEQLVFVLEVKEITLSELVN